jgi:hypothetical protein
VARNSEFRIKKSEAKPRTIIIHSSLFIEKAKDNKDMKIGHLIALLMVVAVGVSCNHETVERADKAGAEGIGFAARLDATRGTVVDAVSELATAGGFKVWAFTHFNAWAEATTKIVMMDNLAVTSSDGGTTWSYGTPLDWPKHDLVSFFAYAPAESATVESPASDGTPQISFTVGATEADQKDLLIATPVKDDRGMAHSDGSSVLLNFKHALSRISFSGLLSEAGDTRVITVKQITLKGLYGSGSTPLTDPAVWTLTGTANQNYTVSVADGSLAGTQFTAQGVSLTADGNYLFLMPQTVARTIDTPTMDVTLVIDSKEVDYSVESLSPAVWQQGRSYNYQLVLSANDLRIIVIDTALTLEEIKGSIVLNAIYLSTDKGVDAANLVFEMGVIDEMRGDSFYDDYLRFGLYAVNGVTHDITIDMETLLPGGGNFTSGQYLILDLRKLVTSWGNDPDTGMAAVVRLTNYSDYWSLEPSKQLPNPAGDVDATTGATTQTPADAITSRGTFILQRK